MKNRSSRADFARTLTRIAAGLVLAGSVQAADATEAPATAEQLARGKYLVTVAGCNDCHTPWKMGPAGPEPDMTRMLSGHPESMALPPAPTLPEGPWVATVAATNTAFASPVGTAFTANLTPDAETGLGKWTLQNFVDTIRTGRHWGRGRRIMPPMPWPMYKHFTDDDFAAIFAYLRTIPPIRNKVPQPLPPVAAGQAAAQPTG